MCSSDTLCVRNFASREEMTSTAHMPNSVGQEGTPLVKWGGINCQFPCQGKDLQTSPRPSPSPLIGCPAFLITILPSLFSTLLHNHYWLRFPKEEWLSCSGLSHLKKNSAPKVSEPPFQLLLILGPIPEETRLSPWDSGILI